MNVDAVVFDLGGVILEVNFDRVFASWARDAGMSAATLRSRFKLDEAYARHERGEMGAAEYFASLRKSLDLPISDGRFLAGWNQMVGGEIAGVANALDRFASKRPLYVFSNTNAAHYASWGADHAAQMSRFKRLFLSFEMGMRKPEARAFEFIAREIGVPLERILFFDDTLENIEAARELGIHAIQVRATSDLEAALVII